MPQFLKRGAGPTNGSSNNNKVKKAINGFFAELRKEQIRVVVAADERHMDMTHTNLTCSASSGTMGADERLWVQLCNSIPKGRPAESSRR